MGDIFGRLFRRRPRPNPPYIPPPIEPGIVEPPFSPPVGPMETILLLSDLNPLGMAYWRNINYHAGRDTFMVAISVHDQLRVLTVDKNTLNVIDNKSLDIHHTGEGIFFSVSRHDVLYVPLDNSLIAVNVFTGDRTTVWESHHHLWQIHANYDETIFSATLKDSNYEPIKWGVNTGQEFPIKNKPDECQVDKSGEWLCVKETRPDDKLVNRFIRINTGAERIIQAEEGAIGHSDCGFGYILGENSFASVGGAVDFFDLNTGERRTVYGTGTWNLGYVSCCNARPDRSEKFLISSADGRLILCDMNGQDTFITNIPAYYQGQPYEHRPKANLCPLGQYGIWTTFVDGKFNLYVVRVL